MYGLDAQVVEEIRRTRRNVLLVVGAEKMPRTLYEVADYNVAIGHQPHSEVSALSVFLDRYFRGKELSRNFPGAKLRIPPAVKNKRVLYVPTPRTPRRGA